MTTPKPNTPTADTVPDWITPAGLKSHAKLVADKIANGRDSRDGFESHVIRFAKGEVDDGVKSHAVVETKVADTYARLILSYLRHAGKKCDGNLLDLGSSLGFVTNSFFNLSNGKLNCYGVDLVPEAVSYAQKNFPNCRFSEQSADKLDNFEDGFFNVINARCFYPFDRTNNVDFILSFFKAFYKKLAPGASVITFTGRADIGVVCQVEELRPLILNLGYSDVRVEKILRPEMYRLPCSSRYLFSGPVYWIFSKLLALAYKIKGYPHYLFVVTK